MQELAADPRIGVESQRQEALGMSQTAGAVEKSLAYSVECLKRPERRPAGGGVSQRLCCLHMQFPGEIVSQESGEQIEFIADSSADGDIAHRTMSLEFAEDTLLRAPTFMKGDDVGGPEGFVGDDDLEVIAGLMGDEQIELDGLLVLADGAGADKKEAEASIPSLGFPVVLEVGDVGVDPPPASASLDHPLEFGEAFEGDAEGELNTGVLQGGHDGIAEEGAVQADFDLYSRQSRADRLNTGQNELAGPVGVVDVAGAVEQVEDLGGLGDGAEERVVAAGPLAFLVVADGGALGMSAGGLDGAVEVQGQACESQEGQALEEQLPQQSADILDALGVGVAEHSTERGHIGQAVESQQTFDQGIVAIGAGVAEVAKAEQEMDDELEEEGGRAEDLAGSEVPKAGSQSAGQIQDGEESLEEDQSGEGSERLRLKLQGWYGMDLTADSGSAKLHAADLRVVKSWLQTLTHTTGMGPPFLCQSALQMSQYVRSRRGGHVGLLRADFTDGEVRKRALELRKSQAGKRASRFEQCELCN